MITIRIEGKHDTGRTTAAKFIRDDLIARGFKDVTIEDVPGLSENEKSDLTDRMRRNMEKPVRIKVVTMIPSADLAPPLGVGEAQAGPVEPNMFGHSYTGKRSPHGYAICDHCHCRENTTTAARRCGEDLSIDNQNGGRRY